MLPSRHCTRRIHRGKETTQPLAGRAGQERVAYPPSHTRRQRGLGGQKQQQVGLVSLIACSAHHQPHAAVPHHLPAPDRGMGPAVRRQNQARGWASALPAGIPQASHSRSTWSNRKARARREIQPASDSGQRAAQRKPQRWVQSDPSISGGDSWLAGEHVLGCVCRTLWPLPPPAH